MFLSRSESMLAFGQLREIVVSRSALDLPVSILSQTTVQAT